MFGVAKLFSSFDDIKHGNTAKTNLKLMDLLPLQHMHLPDGVNVLNKISLAQTFCIPFANCNSNNPSNGRYIATCSNYPDFAVSWKDSKNVTSYLVGMKVRVRFQYGITYGSVSAGTYPYLNINSSGAFPMLAQGKPMATGAISAGQTVELTLIPYGSSYAWDADSNVRESTNDYVIYTDGSISYKDYLRTGVIFQEYFSPDTIGRTVFYSLQSVIIAGTGADYNSAFILGFVNNTPVNKLVCDGGLHKFYNNDNLVLQYVYNQTTPINVELIVLGVRLP